MRTAPIARWMWRSTVGLLLVELGLQVWAFLGWNAAWAHPEGPPHAGVWLCVGGDTVYGTGLPTRAQAFPARLADAAAVTVHSRSAPRAAMVTLLQRLPEWLAAERPERVLIAPSSIDLEHDHAAVAFDVVRAQTGPFPWRIRLLDLLRGSLRGPLRGRFPDDAGSAASIVGTWHAGMQVVAFHDDGNAVLAGQPRTLVRRRRRAGAFDRQPGIHRTVDDRPRPAAAQRSATHGGRHPGAWPAAAVGRRARRDADRPRRPDGGALAARRRGRGPSAGSGQPGRPGRAARPGG